jgi:hypothetical protein
LKNIYHITFIFLLIVFSEFSTAQHSKQLTSSESQQLLLDQLFSAEVIAQALGNNDELAKINRLKLEISDLPVDQVLIFSNLEVYEQIRAKLDVHINNVQDFANNLLNQKSITLIDHQPLSVCKFVQVDVVFDALESKAIADEILASAKWECLQTALGVNTSELCSPLSIIADVADALYASGEHCLLNQNEAVTSSIFENIEGISRDTFEFIDSKISDVATQVQLNNTQDSTNDLNDSLNNNLPVFKSNLSLALNKLNQNKNQLEVIFAQAESLLTRVQINQIEIENIAITSADVVQETQEIRNDTQALLGRSAILINQVAALNQQTKDSVKSIAFQQIEFILANPKKTETAVDRLPISRGSQFVGSNGNDIAMNSAPLSYQLPFSLGGQLELVRERIISHFNTIESLGGLTTKARLILTTGDQAYNSGNYKLAYSNYANAYNALLEISF